MTHKEYCDQINIAQTSSASFEEKKARIEELQELMLSEQDKLNSVLRSIDKSSPEVPDIFSDPKD